ncbi:hypothetical protein [Nocardia aurea]|uniref:VG15 protein n=1 Tax=Nocardia aurea TaxID=2144174 RepID=UPI0033B9460F
MPSQAEIEGFRSDLDLLATAAAAEAIRMAASVEDEDPERMEALLITAIPLLLRPYLTAAGEMATVFYRQSGPGADREAPLFRAPEPSGLVVPPQTVLPDPDIGRIDRPTPSVAVPRAEPRPVTPVPELLRRNPDGTPRPIPSVAATPSPPQAVARPSERATPIVGPVDHRSIASAEAYQPKPAPMPTQAEVESSVRWTLNVTRREAAESTVESRLAGSVQRHVSNMARYTIITNADDEDGSVWARWARADACAFCRMLATRGPEYLSMESARRVVGRRGRSSGGRPGPLLNRTRGSRAIGELYHDLCSCLPVAVRPGDKYEPPEYVDDWMTQYQEAAAHSNGSPKQILSEMRKRSDNKS